MDWNSIDDIIKELKLNSSSDDFKGLKRELRAIMVKLHPDKTGGSFTSKNNEQRYIKASSALEYISGHSKDSQALVPVTALPAIIKAIHKAQLAPVQISQLRTEAREENRINVRSRITLPRIGSGVFASICVGLFTFSSSLEGHPILSIFNSFVAQLILLSFAIYAGIFFILTWVMEHRQEELVGYLISEDGRYQIFEPLLSLGQFSLHDVLKTIRELLRQRQRSSMLILFGARRIQPSIIEKIADIHLLELENRGVIHRLDIPSINPLYKIDENLRHESIFTKQE